MLRDVWTKTLWNNRRAILGWSIGFAVVSMIYGGFFPFAATPEYQDLINGMPEGLVSAFGWDDISSAWGYLGSTVYGLLGSALMAVMAIGFGAKAIAGSEEDGSLELLITMPVTRSKVVLHKSLALLVSTLIGGTMVFLAILVISGPAGIDLPIAHLAAASLGLALLGLLFGALAILVGSVVGRRGAVIGVSAAFAVLAFLMNGLAPLVDSLAWMQNLSPFYWFNASSTLENGLDVGLTALLAVVAAAFVLLAAVAFNRRDVRGT